MTVYHGSDHIIASPVWGYGRKTNDYGLGFYCTEDKNLSMEWAVDEDRDGYSNQYELVLDDLSVLNLSSKEYGILNWITILLDNRIFQISAPIALEGKDYLLKHFLPNYQEYDVIRGYRADDSYFSYARDFLNNTISLEQLAKAMKLGKLGEQIVCKSQKAFENLNFRCVEKADAAVWFPQKETRDRKARQAYYTMDKRGFQRGETYLIKILEEGLTQNDLRI